MTKTSHNAHATSAQRPKASFRRHIKRMPSICILGLHAPHFGAISLILIGIAWSAATLLSQPVQPAHALPPTPSGKQWNLIWGDDFNGSSVSSKWNVQDNSNYGSSNHEDECYRAANASVGGGVLKLTAKRQTVTCNATNPDTGNKTYYFTSGMLTTRAQGGPMRFKFKQGYIEARIKAPKGNPYWPAFWLVGPGDGSTPGWPDYGEFDITEMYGSRPDATFGTLHYACTASGGACHTSANVYNIKTGSAYGGTSNYGTQVNTQSAFNTYSGSTTNFNTYGLLWSSNRVTWYVNGKAVRYFDGNEVRRYEANGSTTLENKICTSAMGCPKIPMSTMFSYEHSIILNLAFGGSGPRYSAFGYTGKDTSSGYSNGNLVATLPGSMEVDYVHVYQMGSTPPASSGGSSSGSGNTTPPSNGGSASSGKSNTGSSPSNGTQQPTPTDNKNEAEVTPKSITNPLVITPSKPGAKIEVKVDGKSIDGNEINPKDLTNGVHEITVTEDGKTTTQKIAIRNPWPLAILNELKAHKATYSIAIGSLLGIVTGLSFGLLRLRQRLKK